MIKFDVSEFTLNLDEVTFTGDPEYDLQVWIDIDNVSAFESPFDSIMVDLQEFFVKILK